MSSVLIGIMFFHFKKCRNSNLKIGACLCTTIYLFIISNLLVYFWVASRMISLSGDIEINPGPKSNVLNWCFAIGHQNLISISAHMFATVSVLSAYMSVHILILYASLKLISIPKFHLMTKIWKYLPFSRSTPPFLRFPLFRNPRCPHLSQVYWENKRTE